MSTRILKAYVIRVVCTSLKTALLKPKTPKKIYVSPFIKFIPLKLVFPLSFGSSKHSLTIFSTKKARMTLFLKHHH